LLRTIVTNIKRIDYLISGLLAQRRISLQELEQIEAMEIRKIELSQLEGKYRD
jgi:hypothetical protein